MPSQQRSTLGPLLALLAPLVFAQLHVIAAQYDYGGYTDTSTGMGMGTGMGYGVSASAMPIPIGLMTDQYTEQMSIAFDYAIEVANTRLPVPLIAIKEELNYGDSFQAFNKLCRMLEAGVCGVFGPSSHHAASHLMTVCDTKDIPYIYSQLTDSWDGFNLHLQPAQLAGAIHSVLNAFEWTRFIFLYESADYLSILHELLNLYGLNSPMITVLRYDLLLNGNYKPVLRRVRKANLNRIVAVGSTDTMPELLRQAQQVGIINEDYKYIIGNLDFHTFDLEEYKYSEANITSFRLFSPENAQVRALMQIFHTLQQSVGDEPIELDTRNGSCSISMEMALMFDAVQMFAETSRALPLEPLPLNCSDRSDSVREHGSSFKNYMGSLDMSESLMTGRVFFENGIRKGFTLDVIELQPAGIVKVGSWDEERNLTMSRQPTSNAIFENVENSLANKTFIVLLSVPNKPYASLVESHKKLHGNAQYEGYGVDLIKELADKLGFNFTLLNGGNDYGTFNKSNNVSTGMVKELMEGRADLAVTDLTITSEREEAIDFSIPFMNLGIAILYLKPQKTPPALFSFMDPFSGEVWLYLGIAFLGVSLSFFILGRLSPTEWDNPYPCVEEPTELENQFTIGNSLWFTTGALLQQGSEIAPKALSTRTVASIWWFFTLIMVSSYTANLAAFLTIENPTSLINDVNDLAENKGGVKYGAKRTGSTRNFFLTSEDPRYKKMNEFMTKNPQFLTETNQEGVDRVKSSTHYAFLMESTSIEYNTVRECNLKKIGDALDEKGYGIAMRKNWPYRDKFNNALLELQEQGVLAKMKNKWWNEVGAGICTSKGETSEASALDMDNLGGVYFVLTVGSCLALLYGIISWVLHVIAKANRHKVPFKDAFMEELKVALDFHTNTRVLKSTASVYSRSRNSSMSIESIEPDSASNSPN